METFILTEVATNLSLFKILILVAVAFFASVISGISGYGGGMTLGLLSCHLLFQLNCLCR